MVWTAANFWLSYYFREVATNELVMPKKEKWINLEVSFGQQATSCNDNQHGHLLSL